MSPTESEPPAQSDCCDVCGAPAEAWLDDRAWCASCLHIQGSCGAGGER